MPDICGFHHVKLPVTDVAQSRDWFCRVLGFEPEIDFVEDGVLMGVGLRQPKGKVRLALRFAPQRAVALDGFDPVALAVTGRAELECWASRLEELHEPNGGIVTGHVGSVIVGLRDPDGIEVRLYTADEDREGGEG